MEERYAVRIPGGTKEPPGRKGGEGRSGTRRGHREGCENNRGVSLVLDG